MPQGRHHARELLTVCFGRRKVESGNDLLNHRHKSGRRDRKTVLAISNEECPSFADHSDLAAFEGASVLSPQDGKKYPALEPAFRGTPFDVEPIREHRRLAVLEDVLPPRVLVRANAHVVGHEIDDMAHVSGPKGFHPGIECLVSAELWIDLGRID